MKKIRSDKGFTLVEVAIVIVIGGMLLASTAALLLNYTKQVQIKTTQRRIDAIDDALQLYLQLNGRYPCAAALNAAPDTAGFGFEVGTGDCTAAPVVAGETFQVAGRNGRTVRIGTVPVRSLNLPDDFIADAWGGRLTYAITEALAKPGTYNRDEGAIYVKDSNNNDVVTDGSGTGGTAHYVIISHGPDGSGATSLQGGGTAGCPAGTLEEENCNNNATFRSTLITGTANNASLYDDMVSIRATSAFGDWIPKGAVVAFNLNACPPGWAPYGPADDRFILGSGITYSSGIGVTGGAGTVALSDAEVGFKANANFIDPTAIPGTVSFAEDIGAPQPHDNMPPYIVLKYCEKS